MQLRRSETRRRTDVIDRVSELLFCSWRWAAPLRFARESDNTACGEERCAGSFCTNGVRDDAFEKRSLVSCAASQRFIQNAVAVES